MGDYGSIGDAIGKMVTVLIWVGGLAVLVAIGEGIYILCR